jgi:hypothetical protein
VVLPGPAWNVVVSGTNAYIADGNSGLLVVPAQCSVTAALLDFFDLVPEQGAVSIRWHVLSDGGPVDFRLIGDDGIRQWEVPFAANGSGSYLAEDRSVNPADAGPITYRLLARTDDRPWYLLAESVLPPATPVLATRLLGASPNPFNPLTTIRFECLEPGSVRLTVYDLAGRRVAVLCDGWLGAGPHQQDWDGRDAAGREVAAGPYLVQLRTRQGIEVQKIMLAK